MAAYKTPGVYVEEISTLPPSVAEVATAIPAFIGYTEKGGGVARIDTLLDYENQFGKAMPAQFQVSTSDGLITNLDRTSSGTEFLMYYSLSMYFKNGGGSCYIVSVGNYGASPQKEDFETGLASLEMEDEPTLIILTDAINLPATDYYDLCQQSLRQCNKLGDRFAIFDVQDSSNPVEDFRQNIGINYLMYGAGYYPYLHTSLNYQYEADGVNIEGLSGETSAQDVTGTRNFLANGIRVSFTGPASASPTVSMTAGDNPVEFSVNNTALTISNGAGKNGTAVAEAWTAWVADTNNDPQGFSITVNGTGNGTLNAVTDQAISMPAEPDTPNTSLVDIKTNNTALYNQIKAEIQKKRVILPPSSAIAGVYASVDRNRGVWKAPANVSLAGVIGPVTKITHEAQENLNVDATAGKSINAIRSFTGKGTLVWGARTLAGNDNEWRYVSVRRLFNTIEESTKKATGFAVFEPNDATTWLKVKAMIEAYLYGLWEQGALAGPTPDAAYYVNVGLGKTMTTQDILEGRMIVEIGIAAVRPAEFIILRFMHKLQEA